MGNRVWTNNASTLLSASIIAGDTSITVTGGTGSLFPSPSGSQFALATIEDVSGNLEIVKITLRAGDILTVVRAQEGTTALAFASGSRIELRVTKGILESFIQRDGDTLTGVLDATGGRIDNGSIRDMTEIVNTPIRGATTVTSNELVVRPSGTGATLGGSELLTQGNLNSYLPSGFGLLKTGMVLAWYGALGSIPTGFTLCDGTASTPDLRDKFVIGAGGSYALSATGGAATDVSTSDGAHTHSGATGSYVLAAADIPAHSHRIWAVTGVNSGSEWDSLPSSSSAVVGDNDTGSYGFVTTNGSAQQIIENTGGGGGHSHTIASDGSHTHTVDILPPYYGLYYIMKT